LSRGTRLLLDCLLQEKGIDPYSIKGYEKAAESHSELETALTVLRGSADVGFCIKHAAHVLGLGFITLAHESFDMVIPREQSYSVRVKNFLDFFDQAELVHHIHDFTGYDLGKIGHIIYPRP
jgi:putative molybdopterin biosynthesis protein